MPRAAIPDDKKQTVVRLIRAGVMTNAAISRETGVSEVTVARYKKEDTGGDGEVEKPLSLKEQNQLLANALTLEKLKNKYLLRYAKTEQSNQQEVEIEYLLKRAAIFGDDDIKRLSEEQEEEEDDTETEE